jgi:predicted transcriptional regulator
MCQQMMGGLHHEYKSVHMFKDLYHRITMLAHAKMDAAKEDVLLQMELDEGSVVSKLANTLAQRQQRNINSDSCNSRRHYNKHNKQQQRQPSLKCNPTSMQANQSRTNMVNCSWTSIWR